LIPAVAAQRREFGASAVWGFFNTIHSKRLKAIYAEEEKLAIVIDARDNAASTVLAAPASMEALHLKLDLFLHHWAKERDVDQPLDGGDIADVAAGVVLDLLTLLRRGAGLAEIASAA
jgi:hypothetical protein